MKTPSLFAALEDNLSQAKARLARAKAHANTLSADLSVAKRIAGKVGVSYVSVNAWSDKPTMSATVRVTVDSFKRDRKLRNILTRALEAATATETSDYASEWCAERSFHFALPNGGSLEIEARLRGDGSTCRKVVSSVKLETVERVEYAIVCD